MELHCYSRVVEWNYRISSSFTYSKHKFDVTPSDYIIAVALQLEKTSEGCGHARLGKVVEIDESKFGRRKYKEVAIRRVIVCLVGLGGEVSKLSW